jgi:hypothetical protein
MNNFVDSYFLIPRQDKRQEIGDRRQDKKSLVSRPLSLAYLSISCSATNYVA